MKQIQKTVEIESNVGVLNFYHQVEEYLQKGWKYVPNSLFVSKGKYTVTLEKDDLNNQ